MEFFAHNWKLLFSGVALLAYVGVQHVLYAALLKACKEFKSALASGTQERSRAAGGFVWLDNVRAMFSKDTGGWLEDSPLPREAVIDSLDNEIWRTSRYGALQRWGLAAPLIGVVLSALGFMVSPPELTGEVKDIMTKLGPLFLGVFVGALMALINQIYLHYAANELGSVRTQAVLWFDANIWKAIRQSAHNALGQATAETQAAAKYLVTSSQELAACNISYRDSLLDLNRQLALVRDAAQTTSKTFETFTTTFGQMSEQISTSLKNLTSLNATASAVENSSAVWYAAAAKVNSASSGIETSSKKFSETCEHFSMNFDDVRRSMKVGIEESTGGLVGAVDKLSEPIRMLESSIQKMQSNTERHSELSAALTNAVEQSDKFLLERMSANSEEANMQREMAQRVRVAIDSLRQLSETVSSVGNAGTAMNQAANELKSSSATIGGSLQTLEKTSNGFAAHCDQLQTRMNGELTETTAGLRAAARELATPVQALNGTINRIATTESGSGISGGEKQLEESARLLADSAASTQQVNRSIEALIQELKLARESNSGKRGLFSWGK